MFGLMYWFFGILFIFQLFISASVEGGGAYNYFENQPVLWSKSSFPIPYSIDPGDLGSFSHEEAAVLVDRAFTLWASVVTSVIRFQRLENIPEEVNQTNYRTYFSSFSSTKNPIIFDDDGKIVQDLFGIGSQTDILGFSSTTTRNNSEINSGHVVFNGFSLQANHIGKDAFFSTVLHELGHFCGLDHTQLLRHLAYNGVGKDDYWIPIMLPTATDDDSQRIHLTADDQLSLSLLYPNVSLLRERGSLSGKILRDAQELPGVNVIARCIDSPTNLIFSTVSGTQEYNRGTFQWIGLPPGKYQLYAEPIDPAFSSISSVGRYAASVRDLSFINPAQSQYFFYRDANPSSRSTWSSLQIQARRSLSDLTLTVESESSSREEVDTQLLGLNSSEVGAVASFGLSTFQYLLVPAGNEYRIRLLIQSGDSTADFDVCLQINQRVADNDPAITSAIRGKAEVLLGAQGDLPLESERYFIAVRNRKESELFFTIQSVVLPNPTATPFPTPSLTPRPTMVAVSSPIPTIPSGPTPTPTAVEVNPSLGLVSLDEIGGTYPRGAAVQNFDVGVSDRYGRLVWPDIYDNFPDAVTLCPLLFFLDLFFPIAKDIEFSGEIDPDGNGSEGVYYLIGGNIGQFPPVIGRLGAVGGPNRGGIDTDNDPLDNINFGTFTGDIIPIAPMTINTINNSSFISPLVKLAPAGNQGFYVLNYNGRIYAEGNALESLDLESPPPDFDPHGTAVDFVIFRGYEITLSNTLYSNDLIGTGAYILDHQGRIYILGNAPMIDTRNLPLLNTDDPLQYHALQLIPNLEGTEWIGLGVLRGDGIILFVPFSDTPMSYRIQRYIQWINPFGSLPMGFPFDIARGFVVEISDSPIYGKNAAGETTESQGRRVGIIMYDGFGGVHTGGCTTRYTAFPVLSGLPSGDIRNIQGVLHIPIPVNIPYFGRDVMKSLKISPPLSIPH